MPRKRSRPDTETKFQNAVLELVADAGCGSIGVNAVAQRAGADKVLIYRYFGDLDGLLEHVATKQTWLPSADELLHSLRIHARNAVDCIKQLFNTIVQHIKSSPAAYQLMRWRKAAHNPLTTQFTNEWRQLWLELPARLAASLDETSQRIWRHVCAIIALLIEAEINDEPTNLVCIETLARDLPALKIDA
ncbi:MAG: TetR/AcrR family transcriptional regulator [Opitutaceae bacterium]